MPWLSLICQPTSEDIKHHFIMMPWSWKACRKILVRRQEKHFSLIIICSFGSPYFDFETNEQPCSVTRRRRHHFLNFHCDVVVDDCKGLGLPWSLVSAVEYFWIDTKCSASHSPWAETESLVTFCHTISSMMKSYFYEILTVFKLQLHRSVSVSVT